MTYMKRVLIGALSLVGRTAIVGMAVGLVIGPSSAEAIPAWSRKYQTGCTTCHTVPDRHKTEPRSAAPSIPQRREFCGTCHAKDAPEKNAPKVDIPTHGSPYLCWQCHYPHLPEGRG